MVDIFSSALIVAGLIMFEIITSIDNAVINAEVLHTMSQRARRWFLTWGIFFSVFLIRGLLPWAIIWGTNPSLGPVGAWSAAFSNDPAVAEAIAKSSPPLLALGGMFLVFLFLHWLFLEPKHYGLRGERHIEKQGVWFFVVVSVTLAVVTWFAIHRSPIMAFGAVMGSTIFFIVHGFRENAAKKEKELLGSSSLGDWSKILYLEVIDASFSIDGVLGAFAFTLAVPLILIGNGIGAIAVRQITISNIERVKRYKYLKNGAMYSILILGCIMVANAFGFHIPEWLSPVATFIIIGYFFWKSRKELSARNAA
ncbi:MAG: DUF475 domain-containing protein [Candidatus Aenigmarchaeota archaeon]|nr:DUF475 domain-containing protein [Candidatus Aenigmarchaeota archaeon]